MAVNILAVTSQVMAPGFFLSLSWEQVLLPSVHTKSKQKVN
jgi:hypothetical protein